LQTLLAISADDHILLGPRMFRYPDTRLILEEQRRVAFKTDPSTRPYFPFPSPFLFARSFVLLSRGSCLVFFFSPIGYLTRRIFHIEILLSMSRKYFPSLIAKEVLEGTRLF
jgi:hypothetical protein